MFLNIVEVSRASGEITFGVFVSDATSVPDTVVDNAYNYITGVEATINIDATKFKFEAF